jgi:hypothetical protein
MFCGEVVVAISRVLAARHRTPLHATTHLHYTHLQQQYISSGSRGGAAQAVSRPPSVKPLVAQPAAPGNARGLGAAGGK